MHSLVSFSLSSPYTVVHSPNNLYWPYPDTDLDGRIKLALANRLVTFPIAAIELQKEQLREEGSPGSLLEAQHTAVKKAWRQEHKAAGHSAATVRRQSNERRCTVCSLLLIQSRTLVREMVLPISRWSFQIWFNLSRNILIDTPGMFPCWF